MDNRVGRLKGPSRYIASYEQLSCSWEAPWYLLQRDDIHHVQRERPGLIHSPPTSLPQRYHNILHFFPLFIQVCCTHNFYSSLGLSFSSVPIPVKLCLHTHDDLFSSRNYSWQTTFFRRNYLKKKKKKNSLDLVSWLYSMSSDANHLHAGNRTVPELCFRQKLEILPTTAQGQCLGQMRSPSVS